MIDDKGRFTTDRVVCRARAISSTSSPRAWITWTFRPSNWCPSPQSLIPFLEHDDANRALMGSNMQRQAVPLLVTEAPLVATGLEDRVARDSRAVAVAEEGGKVASVSGDQIIITEDGKLPETKKNIKHDPDKGVWVYPIRKFMRSNAATCINQKTLVHKGRAREERAGDCRRSLHRRTASWPSAATCSSLSCRGTATTSRTPSSSARKS